MLTYVVTGRFGDFEYNILYAGNSKSKAEGIDITGSYHTLVFQMWVDGELIEEKVKTASDHTWVIQFNRMIELHNLIERKEEELNTNKALLAQLKLTMEVAENNE